jgi:APA family basic amino acid/polyamine antiporter
VASSLHNPEQIIEEHTKEGLIRGIGIPGLAANTLNFIVGAGIFVLPALVAAELGGASILAYLLCGFLILMIMLCFAETGSQITTSGGSYAYIKHAFGPFPGYLANSLYWFGYGVMADAAIANAMADMLAILFPWLAGGLMRALFFAMVFSGFVWTNIRGVKQGIRLVKFNTAVKLTPLLLLIVVGFFSISFENLEWDQWPSLEQLGTASILLFFAFGGGEAALSVSGELKNPSRTVPLGVLLGICAVLTLYILIQTVSQGVLGSDLIAHPEAPLAAVAESLAGQIGATVLIAGAVLSIFGTLSGSILSYPRLLFAGSRSGLTPKFLSAVHPRFSTPYISIIVYAVFVFTFAVTGGFRQLAVISSASLLTIYLGVVLATMKLRIKNKSGCRIPFKVPGGLTVPIVAAITILYFFTNLAKREFLVLGLFIGALSLIYLFMQLIQRRTGKTPSQVDD